MDAINCAKFYRNRLRVWILWGSNFDHSHWIAMSPLTLLGTNVPAVISRFGENFSDVLLTMPPCPVICKSGGHLRFASTAESMTSTKTVGLIMFYVTMRLCSLW